MLFHLCIVQIVLVFRNLWMYHGFLFFLSIPSYWWIWAFFFIFVFVSDREQQSLLRYVSLVYSFAEFLHIMWTWIFLQTVIYINIFCIVTIDLSASKEILRFWSFGSIIKLHIGRLAFESQFQLPAKCDGSNSWIP